MTNPTGAAREVFASLEFVLSSPAVLELQIAASPRVGRLSRERFEVTLDGRDAAESLTELPSERSGRVHVVSSAPGVLRVQYAARVDGTDRLPEPTSDGQAFDAERIMALRPSRYCPSDALAGFANAEFGEQRERPDLGRLVASWVFERLTYDARYTTHLDSAVDTLAKNEGVCRDFAHVTIALCRALGVPANLAAVYAPGLSPMDFHAVVEAWSHDGWEVLDPTRRAPRQSLVRVSSGRDAADTAFATTLRGDVELTAMEVGAVVEGDLPPDDHVERCGLA